MLMVGIGDSLTFGYPYGPKYSWLNLVAERHQFAAINAGIPGETTAEMHLRFQQDVVLHQPDQVVIMGGTNDCLFGLPRELAANYIDKMVNLANTANIAPILAVPPALADPRANKWLKDFRSWLISYATNLKIQLVDFSEGLPELSDGVHPSQAGYQVMAELFEHKLIEWRII